MKIAQSIKQALHNILDQNHPGNQGHPRPHETADLTLEEQKLRLAEVVRNRSTETKGVKKVEASFSQQGLWVFNQFYPESSAYNLQIGLRLTGMLDRQTLKRSLQEIVDRHEVFRTYFSLDEAQLFQLVVPEHAIQLPFTDLSSLPANGREAEAYQLAHLETQIGFDLAKAPLFRFALIRLAPDCHILNCVMSHIICDGWSLGLLIKELSTLYRAFSAGEASPLKPLSIQYGDYARWQRELMESGALQSQIDYWGNKLSGAPPLLTLTTSRPRPQEQTLAGSSQTLPLSHDLVRELKSVASKYRATIFMVALSAFECVLSRYCSREDILIGVPIACRDRSETEDLVGLFVNTVVMRSDLSGNPRFCDLLSQVRTAALEAFGNADLPFAKLVEELKPPRSPSYNPVFQVMFAVIKSAVQPDLFTPLKVSPYIVVQGDSRFDLTMNLIEGFDAQWLAQLEYNTSLFDHEPMTALMADYISTLHAIAKEPEIHLSELPIGVSHQGSV